MEQAKHNYIARPDCSSYKPVALRALEIHRSLRHPWLEVTSRKNGTFGAGTERRYRRLMMTECLPGDPFGKYVPPVLEVSI